MERNDGDRRMINTLRDRVASQQVAIANLNQKYSKINTQLLDLKRDLNEIKAFLRPFINREKQRRKNV